MKKQTASKKVPMCKKGGTVKAKNKPVYKKGGTKMC
jgi:hypothetical protein